MTFSVRACSAGVVLLASLFACSDPDPAPTPPKALLPVTSIALTGTVGTAAEGGITVKVIDYSDRLVEGAKVGFSVVGGDGTVTDRLVFTDAEGLAHTDWTLGQTAGLNEVVASIYGLDSTTRFVAIGNPGAAAGFSITPRILRIPSNSSGSTLTARLVDQFGNVVTGTPTYTSRDEGVVTVSSAGQVSVTNNNRGTSTYIVVSAGGLTDSARVFNLSATDPPCTGITAMAALAIGEVMTTGFVDNGICVPAAVGDREYALVPFFDTAVPSAQTALTVVGIGIRGTSSPSLGSLRARDQAGLVLAAGADAMESRVAIDSRLRAAERREMPSRAAAARHWFSARPRPGRATRAGAVPVVGDQIQINVNADSFCADPLMRTGKVVGVSQRAIVLVDQTNPAGGLTDAEYASYGIDFDTLMYPLDIANFGVPTDIDENGGRVLIFFTHAVNEIGLGALGFAYARDLLPKSGPLGSCPGSNVAEILYMRVPGGSIPPDEMRADTRATIAHEFQHVINSGRRLYVNSNAAASEERWLNEGLSHIAEELLFYRTTGLSPRQDLGPQFSQHASAYRQYLFRNFSRYFFFTRNPGTQGPVGLNDDDDDLESRGAAWSFLRYAADQRSAGNEAAFWQSLVNANSAGIQNLYEHIGADTRVLIRDWALSNFLDGLVTTDAKYSQLSWNLRQVPGFQSPIVFNMVASSQTTATNALVTVTLSALSSEFVRFGVGTNQEAFIRAAGSPASANAPLPRNVLLAIVRTK